MSHPERGSRRITLIPPRTSLDVLRRGVTLRIGGGNLLGGVRKVSRESTAGEPDWSKIVAKHVFQKPSGREKSRPEPFYERDGKIEWNVETSENYDNTGNFGIILQFIGIKLTGASSQISKHNTPDNPVLYIPVGYNGKEVRLFLATIGDIFEFQIVPAQKDVNPFFTPQERYCSQLTTTHDPASMAVFQNNKLVIVGYNPRT